MTSPSKERDSSVSGARSQVDAFLAEMPLWQESKGHPSTIVEVGDSEDHLALAVRKGVVTFETTSRSHRYLEAEFARELDGWRFLVMQLGQSWRWSKHMPDFSLRSLAPHTTLERVSSGHRLRWPGGEATIRSEFDAIRFSWIALSDPAEIAASCRNVNGEPLFHLGVEPGSWPPKPAPPQPELPPEPIEIPPPEDVDPTHLAVIDEIAALLGWTRRTPVEAEVLAVGDQYMGRAVSYRHSRFMYENTLPDDYRSAVCAFSTADVARRFLLFDLGTILRTRRRLPIIRPNRLAPGCDIDKGPNFIVLTWPAGRGEFRVGFVGHQQALTFSWLVTAELGEIVASFQDPDGKPVFQLPHQPPSPVPRPVVGSTHARPDSADDAGVVTPDNDPELPADLVVIDDFLSKSLFWSRQPGYDPLVIEVADFDSRWVLTRGPDGYDAEYRRQGDGTVYGRFSSARGARRFVLMDLGRLWRQSHGLKGVGFKQLAADTRLDDRSDGYRLTWIGGVARFVWDYNAIDFSWIATAELADIVASYIHANGEPLFDPNR